jgi:hypothetical protein
MSRMRLFAKISVTSTALACASFLSAQAQSVTNGLKVYLNLDNNLSAQGPTTINGSVFAGSARYTTGKFGKAASFLNNGSPYTLPSDWAVSLGNLESIYSNSFSVSLWVRTTSTADAAVMGNKDWVSGANVGWVVATTDTKNINWNTSNGYRGDTDLNPPISDGNWHLVTITVDRPANKLVSYIDSCTVSVDALANAGTASLNAGFNTLVGSSGLGYWAGTADVDDLAIWGRALAPAEVDSLYTKGNLGMTVLQDYTTPPATSAFNNKHVLIIGIDGCRPDALLAANATNIYALAANGTVTYNAYTGGQLGGSTQQSTMSGPGWTSAGTGVWLNKHGVSDNTFSGYNSTSYPHYYKRIREYAPNAYLSSIVEWEPLDSLLMQPVTAYTKFRQTAIEYDTTDLVNKAVAHLLSTNPDVLWLHFDAVDHAGHTYGYGPAVSQYMSAIKTVDSGVGTIMDGLKSRPNYGNENWLVIVHPDHGGIGYNHGTQEGECRNIFMIVSGSNAVKQVVSPGPGICCVPPTVLQFLGVPVLTNWGWEDAALGLTPAVVTLPAPWVSGDVGITTLPGSANCTNGTFTLNGSGYDIWGTSDEFQYVWQNLSGDGEVRARVTSVQNTAGGRAKAGVMIRETLAGGSKHALMALRPDGNFEFINRTSTDGSSSSTQVAANSAPNNWVRLTRAGATITAYKSGDGTNWTQVGSAASITMAASVKIGLIVGSVDESTLNTATLDNVMTVLSPGDAWRLQYFDSPVNAGNAADAADPDHDGLSNIWERAFASNPKLATSNAWPSIGIETNFVTLTYRRNISATDITFQTQWSADLGTWSSSDVIDSLISSVGGVETRVSKVPMNSRDSLYLRLTLTAH